MKNKTHRAALALLDAQLSNVSNVAPCYRETQFTYYQGARLALELVLTENYTINGAIVLADNGKHYFVKGDRVK